MKVQESTRLILVPFAKTRCAEIIRGCFSQHGDINIITCPTMPSHHAVIKRQLYNYSVLLKELVVAPAALSLRLPTDQTKIAKPALILLRAAESDVQKST